MSLDARALASGLVLAASIVACGRAKATPTPVSTVGPTAAATLAEPSPAPSAGATSEASPARAATVSANTATIDELVAALTAAGVPNPDRWAREIEEYRPYPSDDPTLQKLQDNLAKYNPDPATLAGILSVLVP